MLMVLAIVSNTSEDSINNIEDQMFLANCPLPIFDQVATANDIVGFAVNYTVTFGNGTDTDGSFFECTAEDGLFGVSVTVKEYGATLFSAIPIGWLGYLADSITVLFERLYAVFTLITYFVTPANFNILGYGLADVDGIALMLIIGIYALCYIAVGVWIYKTVSPFSGVS